MGLARALLPLLLALLGAAGCAATSQATRVSQSGGSLSAPAEQLILVTLDNAGAPAMREPGSTLHAYAGVVSYGVGDQARATGIALARDYGLTELREWPIALLKVQCLVFKVPTSVDRTALLQRLAHDQRVRLAQPLQLFEALGSSDTQAAGARASASTATKFEPPGALAAASYNDPYYGLQHGFTAIGADLAQQWSRGEGVSVAIIDTGVDAAHPDLAGRIGATRNFIDADAASFQADRHGTEVAGIIAALANNGLGIAGIAPAARLLIYKACEPEQPGSLAARCNSFTLALALSAAIDAHAQIVNLSLGGPADPLLAQLVTSGQRRGVIFVGAVPPSGALDGFPLSIPGVIAVDDSAHASAAAHVLYAPGSDIVSLAPAARYDFSTGSSFAAAHVSGAIALLRARAGDLDAAELFNLLARTSMQREGGTMINVCAALAAARPSIGCRRATRDVAAAATVP